MTSSNQSATQEEKQQSHQYFQARGYLRAKVSFCEQQKIQFRITVRQKNKEYSDPL